MLKTICTLKEYRKSGYLCNLSEKSNIQRTGKAKQSVITLFPLSVAYKQKKGKKDVVVPP